MSPRYALSRVPSLDCTLLSEHTVVINITFTYTFTFPFSTNRSAGWAGNHFTDNETAQLKVDVHTAAATFFTQIQYTRSIEFALLASPVESSEIRSTYAARPSNIVHIFSHPTPEQKTITTSSPRVDSTSGQNPEHPHASQAAASPT